MIFKVILQTELIYIKWIKRNLKVIIIIIIKIQYFKKIIININKDVL